MAIILPTGLPAADILRTEGIEVLDGRRPRRPTLRIGLLNLMPDKPTTETQFARLVGRGERDVELLLLRTTTHRSRKGSSDHLAGFYRPWQSAAREGIDGLVVTGAPVELLPFAEVDYWAELCRIFDWARVWVGSSYYICWAAQAALYRFHGIDKRVLPEKRFGVFTHRLLAPQSALAAGLPPQFPVPVSRHTESAVERLPASAGVVAVAASAEAGLCLAEDARNRAVYAFNHFEYDADTLGREYRRDVAAGLPIEVPQNYFPGDDPSRTPANGWHAAAAQLFENWLGLVERGTERAAPGPRRAPEICPTGPR